MQKNNTHYLGNPNLRAANYNYEYSLDEIKEYLKCKNDPVYFIKNYIKIVHPDRGLELMQLYPYQEKMIRAYHKELNVISLTGRQMGKCVSINTIITIRNKDFYEGEPFKITIGEFYEWQSFVRHATEILKKYYESIQESPVES